MQQVNNYKQFRRTAVAFALLSAFAGQAAIAAVSSNTAGPINGRQIMIEGAPIIEGSAIVGTEMSAIVPGVTDEDHDALEDWKYVWKIDDVDVGIESAAGSTSIIPSFTVRPEDAGKKLVLCLRAVAEERSYPVETRYSEKQCSTEVTLSAGTLTITDPGILVVNENTQYSLLLKTELNNNPNPMLEWEISGGADALKFSLMRESGELTMSAKDFEAPEDDDSDNSYNVSVKVTDSVTGATSTRDLTITVVNIVENVNSVRIVDDKGVDMDGNPIVGTTLHTLTALDDNAGAILDRRDVTYRWQRNGAEVGDDSWSDITDANQETYEVKAEDQGYKIRVDVNGK